VTDDDGTLDRPRTGRVDDADVRDDEIGWVRRLPDRCIAAKRTVVRKAEPRTTFMCWSVNASGP
jgi:hypothetical protein